MTLSSYCQQEIRISRTKASRSQVNGRMGKGGRTGCCSMGWTGSQP